MPVKILMALALCLAPCLVLSHDRTDNAHGDIETLSPYIQNISVTVVAENGPLSGEGSGILKTRKMGKDNVTFVWTAAHVVSHLRQVRTVIDPKTGTSKNVVEYADAKVLRSGNQDGRVVEEHRMLAEVIRFSADHDIALLRIRKKNYTTASVKFYLDEKIPIAGKHLWHMGSLLGNVGGNSMTDGIMSHPGRVLNKVVYDQSTVAAFPGSSGGGVYLDDGRCIGQIVRGAGETFNLITPVRRMREWAKTANILWALDDAAPMITEEELKRLPVDDIGVNFSYSVRADSPKLPGLPASGGYTTERIGTGSPHLGELENAWPVHLRLLRNDNRGK